MNTYHTLAEKLDSLECRRDDKARRVSNVAPDTVANITADELENGVSLERLETLNVPVLRYSTQVTIHGILPAFNPEARPGGYRAVFKNGNGSVGVKFSAIDAEKKAIITRAAQAVAKSCDWHTYSNSNGFSVNRYFVISDETQREAQKAATLAALRAIPVNLFYGSVGAFALAYGAGYGVSITFGAIPAADLWEFISVIFGVKDEADLIAREAAIAAEEAAKNAAWKAECNARAAAYKAKQDEKCAELSAFLAAGGPEGMVKIGEIPASHGTEFVRYCITDTGEPAYKAVSYRLEKRGPNLCFSRDGQKFAIVKPGNLEKWNEAAKAGYVFAKSAPVKKASSSVSAPVVLSNPDEPASKPQTFALFCATGKDFRTRNLSRGQAHAALSAAAPFKGNKVASLAAIEGALASYGTTVPAGV